MESPSPNPPLKSPRRILWLHTQPEHYFNCMLDDLQNRTGYQTAAGDGGTDPAAEPLDWIAAFSTKGPGWYKNNAQPASTPTIFLKPKPGRDKEPLTFRGRIHADWRADLLPLKFDAAIVSGYGVPTHRELIAHCHANGIPVAMWTDSNLRSQRGRGLKSRTKRCLKKIFLQRLNHQVNFHLTANSLGLAYWRYFGAPRQKLVLCPCYSDYRRVDAARSQSRANLFAQFNLNPDHRLLFTAARLVDYKGIDLAIEAFLKANLAAQGYRYLIAGTGPYEAQLKRLAGAALNQSIFLIGFRQPTQNLALMAHADLTLLPSRYEPHGIVVAESLAAGTPVIASDVVGATFDLFKHNHAGLTFLSGDAADLQKILEHALFSPNQLATLRAATRPAFDRWYAATSPMRVVPATIAKMLPARGAKP